jgi:YcxB-like protein
MRVAYKLTEAEFVSAQRLHTGRGFLGFVSIAFFYFVAPIVGFLLIYCILLRRDGNTFPSMTGLLAPLIILLAPVWFSFYWRYRFKASRVADSPCVIDFAEDRITSEMPGFSKSNIEWIAIKKYRKGAKVLLIYVSRTSFYIIPRRACENEDYAELIALLERKLASRSGAL